jgi:hypothetical protein
MRIKLVESVVFHLGSGLRFCRFFCVREITVVTYFINRIGNCANCWSYFISLVTYSKNRVTNYCYTVLLSVTQFMLRVTLLIVYGYVLLILHFRG